jgi:hypothetical protein
MDVSIQKNDASQLCKWRIRVFMSKGCRAERAAGELDD